MILAFDPGVCTGWAALDSRADVYGRLLACGVIEWEGFSFDGPDFADPVQTLAIEKPQVYRAGRQKGSQADVIDTAFRAGMLCTWVRAELRRDALYSELFPVPHDWKGSTPKEIHNARVLSKLSPEERALLPRLPKGKMHNLVDAIGLAFWMVGR